MTNEITNEDLQHLKREASLGNVKAVNVDATVLLALIAKVESLAADAELRDAAQSALGVLDAYSTESVTAKIIAEELRVALTRRKA